ncbi:MAG: integrase [Rhizobiaceae bacterium]|nr:MAG: integrase [Rhizobiaceae bacterium]
MPVLVTGIEQRRVCDAEESLQSFNLDRPHSCDAHRNARRDA